MQKKRQVAQWKTAEVKDSIKFIKSQPIVGIVDVARIPAKQFQFIRKKLRGKIGIRVSKNSLLKIALEQASKEKKGIEKLIELVDGQRALVATDMNPFKLYKELETTKIKTPAKGGELAEDDIVIKEGETNFRPGPVIGEFQKAGIPAAIERGKIVIKKDCVLVKKNEKISKDVANALTKLEIFPLTAGLSLVGAYESGLVFGRDSLVVDEAAVIQQIETASTHAHNLAFNIQYPVKLILEMLITKAHHEAMSLGMNANIINTETIEHLLQLAKARALSLQSLVQTT